MPVSTEATILVEHDYINSIEDSAVALVAWVREPKTEIWVTVMDRETERVSSVRVKVDGDSVTVAEVKPHADTTKDRESYRVDTGRVTDALHRVTATDRTLDVIEAGLRALADVPQDKDEAERVLGVVQGWRHIDAEGTPFIPAVVGDPIFWIVDEHGATFAFDDEALARAQADHERRHDAVNLVLYPVTIPAEVAERGLGAVAEWAASNAAPDEHAEYLTGNAPDIAEQDAADDARLREGEATIVQSDTGEVLASFGPRYVMQDYPPSEVPGRVVASMLTRDDASADEIADAAIHAYRGDPLRQHLVEQAAGLLEPGEIHHNPEYLRGMVELIIDATRWPEGSDSDTVRPAVVAAIRAAVKAQNPRYHGRI